MGRISTLKRNYDNEGNLISKECSCCHKIKSVSEFNKYKRSIDGLHSECKECTNEYNKKYRQENSNYFKEKSKKYRQENPDYFKKYRQENTDYFKEHRRKYNQENSDYFNGKHKEYRQKNIQESLQQIKEEIEKEPEKYDYNPDFEIYGIIYLAHNIESDKYYVGQTTIGFDNRYKKGWLYEHSKKDTVKHDLELYGQESFEYTKIFKVAHSQYELDKLEAYYIDYYNSYENGYNENRGNIFTDRGKEK